MTSQTETFQISVDQAEIYESRFVPAVSALWAPLLVDAAGATPGRAHGGEPGGVAHGLNVDDRIDDVDYRRIVEDSAELLGAFLSPMAPSYPSTPTSWSPASRDRLAAPAHV